MTGIEDWVRCPTCGATADQFLTVEKWAYGFSVECTECGDTLFWET